MLTCASYTEKFMDSRQLRLLMRLIKKSLIGLPRSSPSSHKKRLKKVNNRKFSSPRKFHLMMAMLRLKMILAMNWKVKTRPLDLVSQ